MKDLRPDRAPRELAELRRGATVRPEDRKAEEVRRSRRRHRLTAGALIAGVLALVIAPHLIDGSRISSVADRAAAEAGGGVVTVTCPASAGYADAVNPPQPVTIERAVVCHYLAGSIDLPPVMGVVPTAQLTDLNADLVAHSRRAEGSSTGAALSQPGRRTETWVVFGVTQIGQRVALAGMQFPSRFVWAGTGPSRVWQPSPAVQRMLAADLPS